MQRVLNLLLQLVSVSEIQLFAKNALVADLVIPGAGGRQVLQINNPNECLSDSSFPLYL